MFSALKWIEQANESHAKFLRGLRNMHSFSEQLMSATFAMHQLRQESPDPGMSFVTLRTLQGERFCRLSREEFLSLHHRVYETGLDKTDILTGMPFRSTTPSGLDLRASASERCVSDVVNMNVTRVCHEFCRCGESVRRVDIRQSPVEM